MPGVDHGSVNSASTIDQNWYAQNPNVGNVYHSIAQSIRGGVCITLKDQRTYDLARPAAAVSLSVLSGGPSARSVRITDAHGLNIRGLDQKSALSETWM